VAVAEVGTEIVRFGRDPEIAGVESENIESSPQLWRRFHDMYAVTAVVDSSRLAWRRGRERCVAATGDVCLAGPGDLTVMTAVSAPQTLTSVLISPRLMEQFADGFGVSRRPVAWRAAQSTDPALGSRVAELGEHLRAPRATLRARVVLAEMLRMLFMRCVERRGTPASLPASRASVWRARDYIEKSYQQQLALDDVATVAGVTRFHLTRIFAAEFGVTPRAYLLHVRLARAKALLADGVPVQQAAADTGFSDQSHFTRHFRKTYGITPVAYASAVRRG
jgi:AraC-like DNA-binding protein